VLITYQDFLQRVVPTTPNTFYSSKKGVIKLPSKRDWVIQIPLPDAGRFYGWSFCISKEGYRAKIGHIRPGVDVPQVVLEGARRLSICDVQESQGKKAFEVIEVL
jgi:hypothetical protein